MRLPIVSVALSMAALLGSGCGPNQAMLDQLNQCNQDYRTLAERLAARPAAPEASPSPALAQGVIDSAGPELYVRAVAAAGFSVVTSTERFIQVDMFGLKVQLFHQPASAQLFAGFSSKHSMSPLLINDWNRTKRFSRAYIDLEGDPILESDIDLEGGVTEIAIVVWIRTFAISLKAFNDVLLEEAAQQPSL